MIRTASKILISTVLFAMIFSCDKIEEPFKNSTSNGGGTEIAIRKVLLEDYTGHTCVNCPGAAKLAADLHEIYGNKLIIIGVHAGHFAAPANSPFDIDLRSEVGNAWNSHFNIQGYPSGLINRTSPGGQYIQSVGNWATRIADIIDIDPVAKLNISTTYNETSRKLDVRIETTFISDVTGNPILQVVLTENNIVGAQLNNNPNMGEIPIIYDFVHKHVLRSAVNGSWGENLLNAGGLLVVDNTYEHNYSITLNEAWNDVNISVVAFVYNESDYEIYQVEEKIIE